MNTWVEIQILQQQFYKHAVNVSSAYSNFDIISIKNTLQYIITELSVVQTSFTTLTCEMKLYLPLFNQVYTFYKFSQDDYSITCWGL